MGWSERRLCTLPILGADFELAGPTGIYIFRPIPIVPSAPSISHVLEHTLVSAGDDDADARDVASRVSPRDHDLLSARHAYADRPAPGVLW